MPACADELDASDLELLAGISADAGVDDDDLDEDDLALLEILGMGSDSSSGSDKDLDEDDEELLSALLSGVNDFSQNVKSAQERQRGEAERNQPTPPALRLTDAPSLPDLASGETEEPALPPTDEEAIRAEQMQTLDARLAAIDAQLRSQAERHGLSLPDTPIDDECDLAGEARQPSMHSEASRHGRPTTSQNRPTSASGAGEQVSTTMGR